MSRPARLAAVVLAFALWFCASVAAGAPGGYAGRDDVRQFIAEMVQKHGFARSELRTLFSRARFQPTVIAAITPPTEPPWPQPVVIWRERYAGVQSAR